LSSLEYRYIPTEGPLDVEPRVIELRETRVTLEVEVPPIMSVALPSNPGHSGATPPAEANRQPVQTLLGQVRIKATAKDAYEVNAADLHAALDQSGKVLAEMWPKTSPNVSLRQGVSLDLQSPVADGTLGPRGFRVSSPNLAERGGIEVGDVILAVNGQPINNFVDLYRLYSRFQKDASLTLIQLDLERQGRPITKTYRIR
jgi:membrane-associated protease RseP (regulator of RpoE activity)